MATEPKEADAPDSQEEGRPVATGFVGKIQEMFRNTKEHAETYPYVWGSYLTVYGGFGLWLIYRWRRLRGTEDRVRALQERLRIVFEEQQPSNSDVVTEQTINSSSLKNKVPPPADKVKIIKEHKSNNSAQVTEQSSDSASLENKVPPADKATE